MDKEEYVIPESFCNRIKSYVRAKSVMSASDRIIVNCKYYSDLSTETKYPCIKDVEKHKTFRKCIIKTAVQREMKDLSRLLRQ